MENISSVVCKLESEIKLPYCVKRLLTKISFLSLVNTPNPSREVCRCVISFSRSIYNASLVSRKTFIYLYNVLGYFAKFIMWESRLYIGFHRFVFIGAFGKFSQMVDCRTQFGCKLIENEYQQ